MPRKTSAGRSGITASCSSVPACRSLTTPRLVITVPTNTRMTPASPGIMMYEVFSSGLYRMCVVTSATVALTLAVVPTCPLRSATNWRRAACAVNSWLPSMSTVGPGALPVTMATAACPSRSWSWAHAADDALAGLVAATLKDFGSACAVAAAPGPATTVGMSDTSKLAA